MADYLKKLPDGASGTTEAQEALSVGDYNRLVGVLNGTAGAVGAGFFAANPAPGAGLAYQVAPTYDTYKARAFSGINADGATDDTTLLAAAAAYLSTNKPQSTIDLGGATYAVNDLAWADQVNLINGTLKHVGGGTATNAIKLLGSESGTSAALAADAHILDQNLQVPNSAIFSVGQTVELYDLTYKYTVPANTGRNQEINRVASIPDGTHVTLANPLIGNYLVANTATLVVLNAITRLHIARLRVINPLGQAGGCFQGIFNWGVIIEEGCEFIGPNDRSGIRWEQSANCQAGAPHIYDGQNMASGNGEAISIGASSHHMTVWSAITENVRTGTVFYDNARYCKSINHTDTGAFDSSVNTHGSGNEHCSILGLTSTSCLGSAIAVGFSTCKAFDNDILIDDYEIAYPSKNGITIASPSGTPNTNVKVGRGHIRGFGQGGAGSNYALTALNAADLEIDGLKARAPGNNFATGGVQLINIARARVLVELRDLPNAYGIRWATTCDSLDLYADRIFNVSSFKLKADDATSTNVRIFMPRSDVNSVSLQGTEKVYFSDLGTVSPQVEGITSAPVYGVTVTPTNGRWQTVTVTDGVAFTVAAPANQPSSTSTGELTVEILNSSGGVMGVITWNATYLFQGLVWANPASTKKRFVTFRWNGLKWVAIAMSSADY